MAAFPQIGSDRSPLVGMRARTRSSHETSDRISNQSRRGPEDVDSPHVHNNNHFEGFCLSADGRLVTARRENFDVGEIDRMLAHLAAAIIEFAPRTAGARLRGQRGISISIYCVALSGALETRMHRL